MNRPANYIVFLCYGNVGVFHECAFALLSLCRLHGAEELKNIEVCLYTDNPAWFQSFKDCPLKVSYREVDKQTLRQWRGKIDFVHRVKIEALKDVTKDKTGNILYTDTDIVFTHRIDKMLEHIGNGMLYMHIMEGIVSNAGNPILSKLNKHLQKNKQRKIKEKPLHELAMWNAGVLGFNTKYKYILDEALAFTDSEYPTFPKHVIEQFAFSVYFQQAGPIKAAAPFILHYWNLKEARVALASFFEEFKNKSWTELVHYSQTLQIPALMQEKVNFLHNRSVLDKLRKKQWLPGKPDWSELIKQV